MDRDINNISDLFENIKEVRNKTEINTRLKPNTKKETLTTAITKVLNEYPYEKFLGYNSWILQPIVINHTKEKIFDILDVAIKLKDLKLFKKLIKNNSNQIIKLGETRNKYANKLKSKFKLAFNDQFELADIEIFINNNEEIKVDETKKINIDKSNFEPLSNALVSYFLKNKFNKINNNNIWITKPNVTKYLGKNAFSLIYKMLEAPGNAEQKKNIELTVKRIVRGTPSILGKKGASGESLLHISAKQDNLELFKYFINTFRSSSKAHKSNGSIIRATKDNNGKSPVNYAIDGNAKSCITWMYKNCVSVFQSENKSHCGITQMVDSIHDVELYKKIIINLASSKVKSAHKIAKETEKSRQTNISP